ncbi:MAG: hypothetical protein R3F11_04520 [Verrucomicrobiales bacterium]
MKTLAWKRFGASLAIFWAGTAVSFAQGADDKVYDLSGKFSPVPGMKALIETTNESDLKTEINVAGQALSGREKSSEQRKIGYKYASPDKKEVLVLERTGTSSRQSPVAPTPEEKEMGNPLKERRIIAEKGADGKWAYSTDGELEAEAIELLEKLAKGDDLEDNEMFDGVKGKTGEKLKFNAEQLISKLGGELKKPTAEATGKIVKIEERDGVECAIVNVEISIKGEMESDGVPAQVGLSVKGELCPVLGV